MPIDEQFITARRAQLESEKRNHLAQANACAGAIALLDELQATMRKEIEAAKGDDLKRPDPAASVSKEDPKA
jgi:hypothetical protein